MANYTPNYGLHQWVPEDNFLRTDFNEDFSKIDSALGELAAPAAMYARMVPNLGYYAGYLSLVTMVKTSTPQAQRNVVCDSLRNTAFFQLTGNAVHQTDRVVVTGQGNTGGYSSVNFSVYRTDWTHAQLWLALTGGTAEIRLNGAAMTRKQVQMAQSISGEPCMEHEFHIDTTGASYAQIQMDLTATSEKMTVYHYFIVFF